MYQRTGDKSVSFTAPRDVWWHEVVANARPYCPPEPMNAEDHLFMLYTSGSTGKPKGLVHTTAGYLLGAAMSMKVFIFCFIIFCKFILPSIFLIITKMTCLVVWPMLGKKLIYYLFFDIVSSWITGHTYIVYGPLANGATTVLFESIPTYPTPSRYWQLVDKHRITQFYTAPTAIRALRRLGDHHVADYSLKSLRVLGSVGEPINPEAWLWYEKVVGRGRCAVVDTYWQTETGSIIITPLPAAIATKPGIHKIYSSYSTLLCAYR